MVVDRREGNRYFTPPIEAMQVVEWIPPPNRIGIGPVSR